MKGFRRILLVLAVVAATFSVAACSCSSDIEEDVSSDESDLSNNSNE